MERPTAFRAGGELVAQADVGEGAAHHHFVIAPARAVRIEFVRLYAFGDEIFSGGRIDGDRAGGRDMVGGDAVAEDGQDAGAADIGGRAGGLGRIFVKRRELVVRGGLFPLVEVTFVKWDCFSPGVAS